MKRTVLLLLIVMTFPFAGCGGTSAEPVQSDMIDPPTTWTADGQTWTYQPSLSQSDEELLTKFFQIHPDFQGSSDFEGPPKMMVGKKSDRRFYWIRGGSDSVSWSCVHFEGGQFRTSEGTGNPF
jgi:hypothetical protein